MGWDVYVYILFPTCAQIYAGGRIMIISQHFKTVYMCNMMHTIFSGSTGLEMNLIP